MTNKNRIFECLCVLEEAIVVARHKMNLHEAESLNVSMEYIMRTAKITKNDLSEYQINKRVENFKEGK